MKVILFLFLSSICLANSEFSKTLNNIQNEIELYDENLKNKKEMIAISSLKSFSVTNKLVSGTYIIYSSPVFLDDKIKKQFKEKIVYERYFKIFQKPAYSTAFLYKGKIITTYHSCRGIDSFIKDNNGEIFLAKIEKFDVNLDVCILNSDRLEKRKEFDFNNKKMIPNEKEEFKDKIHQEIARKINKEKDIDGYGEVYNFLNIFYISNISVDRQKDQWSKPNSYIAKSNDCKSGVSGSPIVSKSGFRGMIWGSAENKVCFFIDRKEIDLIIN